MLPLGILAGLGSVDGWLTQFVSWHTMAVVIGLLLYILATQGLQQRRPPTAAVAWVLLIALLPYIGVPLFLLFGSRKRRRVGPFAGAYPAVHSAASTEVNGLEALADALHLPPPAAHGVLTVHTDGSAALRAMFDVVRAACTSLHICTYVIGDDAVGAALVDQVKARVAAGVTVRVLVDGIGGLRSWRIVRRLRAAGAKVAWFVPPIHRPLHGRTNLRNHRKLVIADGAKLWSGGRNLAAEYFVGALGTPPWADLSFDTDGPLAASLDAIFVSDWNFATGEELAIPTTQDLGPQDLSPARGPECTARPVPSGPDYAEDTLHALLLVACYRAHTSIEIATPYFVPDESILRALSLAAQRGVRVRLLLPAYSNHRLADLARRRALRQIADAGAEVRMLPSMLHAKMVAVDDAWLLLGSANIDSRSLFLNYELMIALQEKRTIATAVSWYNSVAAQALPWREPSTGIVRDLGEGLLLWLAFQL